MDMSISNLKKQTAFAALCLACVGLIGKYVYSAKNAQIHSRDRVSVTPALPPRTAEKTAEKVSGPNAPQLEPKASGSEDGLPETPVKRQTDGEMPAAKPSTPVERTVPVKTQRIFFRHNGSDADYGRLAFVDQQGRFERQFPEKLSCEVVSVAADRGICLKADRGVFTTYKAELFDSQTFRTVGTFPLKGPPSRCRISTDGSMAALTVFLSGHGYASVAFSTQTLLINARTAEVLADLEDFQVIRDGQPIRAKDFNFWGVTFTRDGRDFYCTLSTNGQHLLVKGDVAARTVTVVHDQVECPSLSPDETRIAYKKRVIAGGRMIWRTQVLILSSGAEILLSEQRSVDDQLEWLDENHVLYTLPIAESGTGSASTNVWVTAADGQGKPEVFLQNAYSPSVER